MDRLQRREQQRLEFPAQRPVRQAGTTPPGQYRRRVQFYAGRAPRLQSRRCAGWFLERDLQQRREGIRRQRRGQLRRRTGLGYGLARPAAVSVSDPAAPRSLIFEEVVNRFFIQERIITLCKQIT